MKEAVPLPEEAQGGQRFANFDSNSRRSSRIGGVSEGADVKGGRESDRIRDRLRQRVSHPTHEDRCFVKRSVSLSRVRFKLDWMKCWP